MIDEQILSFRTYTWTQFIVSDLQKLEITDGIKPTAIEGSVKMDFATQILGALIKRGVIDLCLLIPRRRARFAPKPHRKPIQH